MKQWLMLAALGCAADPSKSESDSSSDTSDTLGCPVTLTHSAVNEPDEVWLAVDIPGWRPEDHPLVQGDDGSWTIDARLDPGAYAYRFIEFAAWTEGGAEISLCDASAPLAVCANPTTWENDWAQDWREPSSRSDAADATLDIWWENHAQKFPHLFEVAKKVL